MCVCVYLYMSVCLGLCLCVCARACLCVCVCVHVYVRGLVSSINSGPSSDTGDHDFCECVGERFHSLA